MDNFGSSEEGNLDHLGACGGVPNMHGAGDDEIASGAHEAVLFTDRDAFLREIHTDFLENINPIENGLVDVLRGVDALTSGDEQAIDGKETRRDKARMFWNMLHRIPEKDFESSFVPKLKMEYPHLMSRREFRLEDAGSCSVKCLRHVMMKRIDLKRIVDILPSAQCCSQEEYNQLVAVQHSGEKEWADIFDLLTRNVSNFQLCQEVEKLLLKKKIGNTEPYVKVAAHGFACTCSSSAQRPLAKNSHTHTRPERLLSALKPLDGGSSSGTYPSSLMSPKDQHFEDRTDSGVMSLADVLIPSAQLSDLEQFSSTADKKRYREVEEQINTTITVASSIRMEFRHLEKI